MFLLDTMDHQLKRLFPGVVTQFGVVDQWGPKYLQAIKAISIALSYYPELDGETLLLKIEHT